MIDCCFRVVEAEALGQKQSTASTKINRISKVPNS